MIAIPSPESPKEVYRDLLRINPNAMVVVGFEAAYVGMTVTHPVIAIYDYDECLLAMAADMQCCEEEAEATLMNIVAECCEAESPVFVRCR